MSEESKFKTALVKQFKSLGHYGRRIEDQYQVGVLDLILIPNKWPVFFCEAKIIRNGKWFEPRERQFVELQRLSLSPGYAVPCLLGFDGVETYLSGVTKRAILSECVKKRDDETVVDFFKRFYSERKEL